MLGRRGTIFPTRWELTYSKKYEHQNQRCVGWYGWYWNRNWRRDERGWGYGEVKHVWRLCPFLFSFFIFILLQLSAFSPHPSTPPQPIPPSSPTSTLPWFWPCALYSSSCRPLSPLSPPHSPLAIVTLFLISMSLVIFCLLFCCWLCSS